MRTYCRKGRWLRIVCAGLIFVAGCANQNQIEQPPKTDHFLESLKIDLADWPDRFIEDSKATFLQTDNITALLLAGGASIAMHNSQADDNIAAAKDAFESVQLG